MLSSPAKGREREKRELLQAKKRWKLWERGEVLFGPEGLAVYMEVKTARKSKKLKKLSDVVTEPDATRNERLQESIDVVVVHRKFDIINQAPVNPAAEEFEQLAGGNVGSQVAGGNARPGQAAVDSRIDCGGGGGGFAEGFDGGQMPTVPGGTDLLLYRPKKSGKYSAFRN